MEIKVRDLWLVFQTHQNVFLQMYCYPYLAKKPQQLKHWTKNKRKKKNKPAVADYHLHYYKNRPK